MGNEESIIRNTFCEKEIKGAVWDNQGNNSLGLNVFNFSFIKKFWDILNRDIKFYGLWVMHLWETDKGVKCIIPYFDSQGKFS